jgi:hypothetical protein
MAPLLNKRITVPSITRWFFRVLGTAAVLAIAALVIAFWYLRANEREAKNLPVVPYSRAIVHRNGRWYVFVRGYAPKGFSDQRTAIQAFLERELQANRENFWLFEPDAPRHAFGSTDEARSWIAAYMSSDSWRKSTIEISEEARPGDDWSFHGYVLHSDRSP